MKVDAVLESAVQAIFSAARVAQQENMAMTGANIKSSGTSELTSSTSCVQPPHARSRAMAPNPVDQVLAIFHSVISSSAPLLIQSQHYQHLQCSFAWSATVTCPPARNLFPFSSPEDYISSANSLLPSSHSSIVSSSKEEVSLQCYVTNPLFICVLGICSYFRVVWVSWIV